VASRSSHVGAWLRQDSRQRGKEGTIGWAQRRASLLPSEHDQLMPQDEQLDVFGELPAPAPDQQPQHGREGEIGERKEHSAILPSTAPEKAMAEPRQQQESVAQPSPIWHQRAPVKQRKEALWPSRTHRTGI
jgi:hypothetical protein